VKLPSKNDVNEWNEIIDTISWKIKLLFEPNSTTSDSRGSGTFSFVSLHLIRTVGTNWPLCVDVPLNNQPINQSINQRTNWSVLPIQLYPVLFLWRKLLFVGVTNNCHFDRCPQLPPFSVTTAPPLFRIVHGVCVCVCVCGYLYFMYQSYKSCLHAATSFFSFNAVVSASASQTSSPIPDALLGDAGAACRHTIRSCWLRIGFRIIIITQLPISRKGPVRPRHSVD